MILYRKIKLKTHQKSKNLSQKSKKRKKSDFRPLSYPKNSVIHYDYSNLNASIGLSFAAFLAGKIPKIIPVAAVNKNDSTTTF